MRGFRLFVLLCILFTVVSVSAQADLIPLKVQVSPFMSFAPHYIAQAEGYFEAQGLAVEFVPARGTSESLPMLLNGDLDVIGGILNAGVFNAIARNGGVRLVADKGSMPSEACAPQVIFARQALFDSGALEDAQQVRTLIHNQENTISYAAFLLDRFLNAEFGLSVDDLRGEGVEDVLLGEAMNNGIVDIAIISEPWISRYVNDGSGAIWVGGNDVLPDYTYAYIAYGNTLLENAPEVGERFMIAYLQGVRQYNRGATERNIDILEAALGLDRSILEQACFPAIRDDGALHTDSVMEFQAWALERGLVDHQIEAEGFYDSRFIEAANAALEDAAGA